MAYLEMSLVLAATILYFDFERAPADSGALGRGQAGSGLGREREDEFQLYERFILEHNGPSLVFNLTEDVIWIDGGVDTA
ncbi:hypothetical protein DM02DRAFT_695471 [Periconia macrospinosa]|uniref:Uncharacterized protein n=1 Tax=Periconia macrospinosa TaxID=97972 RepID=A0A2V1D8W4_9PLEO|nr:hypothetical protein DM02DRAFT_695471 [Periconia macrospinosa]